MKQAKNKIQQKTKPFIKALGKTFKVLMSQIQKKINKNKTHQSRHFKSAHSGERSGAVHPGSRSASLNSISSSNTSHQKSSRVAAKGK